MYFYLSGPLTILMRVHQPDISMFGDSFGVPGEKFTLVGKWTTDCPVRRYYLWSTGKGQFFADKSSLFIGKL